MLMLILIALLLIAVTVIIHGVGTVYWLSFLKYRGIWSTTELRPLRTLVLLVSTAIFLLALHLFEIMAWAVTYLMLPTHQELGTLEQSIYFSSITFSTLGYGDLTLSSNWQLLSGIEAMNGILLCGWSTALIFALLESIWRRLNGFVTKSFNEQKNSLDN